MAAPTRQTPVARLRYVREAVGVFVVAAALLVVAAIVVAPQTWRNFAQATHLTIRLPAEGSLGLRRGADVLVMGTMVGTVNEITVSPDGEMEADVSVRGNFSRFIGPDSRAIIRKPLGIGEAFVEITRGHGRSQGGSVVINAVADKAPTELVDEALRDIRQEALPMLHELRGAVAAYASLASDLKVRQAQLGKTLDHFNTIADTVEHGSGLAPAVLNDPKLAEDIRTVVSGLRASVEKLDAELRQSGPTIKSLGQAAAELPGLLLQAQETLRQTQRLAEAAQRSWLMRVGADGKPSAARAEDLGADRTGAAR